MKITENKFFYKKTFKDIEYRSNINSLGVESVYKNKIEEARPNNRDHEIVQTLESVAQ